MLFQLLLFVNQSLLTSCFSKFVYLFFIYTTAFCSVLCSHCTVVVVVIILVVFNAIASDFCRQTLDLPSSRWMITELVGCKENIEMLWQIAFIIHHVILVVLYMVDVMLACMYYAGIACLLCFICQTHSGWCRTRAVAFGSSWHITMRQTWRQQVTSATHHEHVVWHKKLWHCRHHCLCQQAAACLLGVMKNDLMSWRYITNFTYHVTLYLIWSITFVK